MSGFKNESLNSDFECGIIDMVIIHVEKCCEEMKAACAKTGNYLCNDEDKITNRLVQNHLNATFTGFRFILQSPENYIYDQDSYKGRTDIKVVSFSWFDNQKDYYTIECKRIDGNFTLNNKYISEGVSRFVTSPPKYLSHNKKNIMLGYIVQVIDIPQNAIKIDDLQCNLLENVTVEKFLFLKNSDTDYYLYSCRYQSDVGNIELRHLFYDFSSVVQN